MKLFNERPLLMFLLCIFSIIAFALVALLAATIFYAPEHIKVAGQALGFFGFFMLVFGFGAMICEDIFR